jgi:hypothetical protein
LTSASILKIENLDEDFMVCTNVCKEGLVGVLTQKEHVVCYESRKLKENESNYATHGLELVSIVHALKMWRHYLMGRRFELRTDYCGLKHLFGQPTLNNKQTRCLEFLIEYDFEIKHIKGKESQVLDPLSKRTHEMYMKTINMYNTYLKDGILEAANSDQRYLKIKETSQQDNLQQKFNCYELKEDGILIYRGKMYVSNSGELKNIVLREMHNVPYVGHPGYHKTIAHVRS